jgi:hypothetical protein
MKVVRVKHNHESNTRNMDYQKLHDQDTKDSFTMELRHRFALLEDGFICQEVDTDLNSKWKQIKELYTDTAQEDQENFDVAELMGINQNAEKAKTDDQTRRKPRIEKKYLKFSTEIFER